MHDVFCDDNGLAEVRVKSEGADCDREDFAEHENVLELNVLGGGRRRRRKAAERCAN